MDVKGKLIHAFLGGDRNYAEQQNESVKEKQHSKGK